MRSRFVRPESRQIPISGGDFIVVKQQINAGEHQQMFSRMLRDGATPEGVKWDLTSVASSRILAYLIGWSFVDEDGRPVPMSPEMPLADRESAILALDLESFAEIREAIDAHITAADAARETAREAAEPTPAVPIAS